MTDGRVYNSDLAEDEVTSGESGRKDDRLVFTEGNPSREVQVAAGLATASRVLRGFNDELAAECIEVARALWEESGSKRVRADRKIAALSELFLTTQDATYRDQLLQLQPEIAKLRGSSLWPLGRLQGVIENEAFWNVVKERVEAYDDRLSEDLKRNPYGVSYRPRVWGAGWDIQRGGFEHYFLHKGWPEVISSDHFLNALNFVLGSHPGSNTASFVSGVGSDSVTVAYGINRADWSFIPGGSVSGTGLIRPDLPELKEWPFFWQQTEYVVGGGASHFMFLALAARDLFD
jgi:hypothetical protein